jgi:hypothetical protein
MGRVPEFAHEASGGRATFDGTGTQGRPSDRAADRTKEAGMYERVVVYTYSEDKDELEAKAREGAVPIVTGTPGYISYAVMFYDDKVVSVSQWESEAHAKEADSALIDWVKANTTMEVEQRFMGDLAWLERASR